jgi:GNAT superfamily N-acetyltransferase
VRELAAYERAGDEARLDEADVVAALFCEHPAAFCDVVEAEGNVVALALWYLTFSTWVGRHGIYLEDLYVQPDHRRQGHATALLATLARRCVERGYGRLEWAVLDWNAPALEFYRSLGAQPLDEWTVHRLSGDALAGLARTNEGR